MAKPFMSDSSSSSSEDEGLLGAVAAVPAALVGVDDGSSSSSSDCSCSGDGGHGYVCSKHIHTVSVMAKIGSESDAHAAAVKAVQKHASRVGADVHMTGAILAGMHGAAARPSISTLDQFNEMVRQNDRNAVRLTMTARRAGASITTQAAMLRAAQKYHDNLCNEYRDVLAAAAQPRDVPSTDSIAAAKAQSKAPKAAKAAKAVKAAKTAKVAKAGKIANVGASIAGQQTVTQADIDAFTAALTDAATQSAASDGPASVGAPLAAPRSKASAFSFAPVGK